MGTLVKRTDHAGLPTWQAKIRKAGFPAQSRTFPTKREADEWMKSVEAAMTAGSYRSTKLASATTMRELFETYRDAVTVNKGGKDVETIRLNALMESPLGQYAPANLNKRAMASWRDKRLKEVSGSTVNRELNLIGHVIEKARAEWGIELVENPVHQIERPKNAPARERRFREGEEAKLMEAIRTARNQYLHATVVLALETAMRQAEIVNLKWEFVDITRRRIHLVVSKDFSTKNGSGRVIPLSTKAVEVLQGLGPLTTGRVFPDLTTEALKRAFIRATKRAGLDDFHFHDLRHEATSRLFEKGLNIAEVRGITGHKSLSSLERYVHMDTSKLAERLD